MKFEDVSIGDHVFCKMHNCDGIVVDMGEGIICVEFSHSIRCGHDGAGMFSNPSNPHKDGHCWNYSEGPYCEHIEWKCSSSDVELI